MKPAKQTKRPLSASLLRENFPRTRTRFYFTFCFLSVLASTPVPYLSRAVLTHLPHNWENTQTRLELGLLLPDHRGERLSETYVPELTLHPEGAFLSSSCRFALQTSVCCWSRKRFRVPSEGFQGEWRHRERQEDLSPSRGSCLILGGAEQGAGCLSPAVVPDSGKQLLTNPFYYYF